MREITAEEREFARRLAEACLRDRMVTWGARETPGLPPRKRGLISLARIAPETEAEAAWAAYCRAR